MNIPLKVADDDRVAEQHRARQAAVGQLCVGPLCSTAGYCKCTDGAMFISRIQMLIIAADTDIAGEIFHPACRTGTGIEASDAPLIRYCTDIMANQQRHS